MQQVFVKIMANFWKNNFDNGNIVGNIDFSITFAIRIFSLLLHFLIFNYLIIIPL